ncbi:Retaining alpha-galactosidase precursor [compost metagenome]
MQHLAESPEGMATVPAYVKSFLQTFPASWQDTKFMDGYPGKFVVMARKAGSKWYIAGINGENSDKLVYLDLSKFNAKEAEIITDAEQGADFITGSIDIKSPPPIKMKPFGGFVIVVTQK